MAELREFTSGERSLTFSNLYEHVMYTQSSSPKEARGLPGGIGAPLRPAGARWVPLRLEMQLRYFLGV